MILVTIKARILGVSGLPKPQTTVDDINPALP